MGNLCGCPRAERLRKAIDAAVDSLETTPEDSFPFEAMDILTEAQDERDPREKQFDELFVAMRLFVKDPPPQNPLARKRWDWVVRKFEALEESKRRDEYGLTESEQIYLDSQGEL